MNLFKFIAGAVLIACGAMGLFGTAVMITSGSSKFSLGANLLGLVFVGLLPLAVGILLWLKSGTLFNSKPMWFLVGFIVSWLAWSTIAHVRMRPRDYSQHWEAWEREGVPWIQRAYGRKLGSFLVFAPAREDNAAIMLYLASTRGLPGILIQDENQDGSPDAFMVGDSKYCYVCLEDKDSDGAFDKCTYSTGVDEASCVLDDNDMDGVFDLRTGPGGKPSVHIDGAWYELIWKDKKRYVNMDGRLTMVRESNGVWHIASDDGGSQ